MLKTTFDNGVQDLVPVVFQARDGRSIGKGTMRVKEGEGKKFLW